MNTVQTKTAFGEIHWSGTWRRYVLCKIPESAMFEQICLREISDFID